MFQRISRLLVTATVGLMTVGTNGAVGKPKRIVPVIAHMGRFIVGVSTCEQMERKLGRAHRHVGQHPHSFHDWQMRDGGLYVGADGTDYNSEGLIVNQLEVDGDTVAPQTMRQTVAWMGLIVPGMTRQQVLHLLKNKLPPPKVKAQQMMWQMTGSLVVRAPSEGYDGCTYNIWSATLHYNRGRVDWIEVICD